jgi:hypothetical protein
MAKDITRLANWTNHIGGKGSGTRLADRLDLMIRLVQSRPDQIVHPSVHNGEMFPARFLAIQNLRH